MIVSYSQVFNHQWTPQKATAALTDDFFEDFENSVFPAWTATGLWHVEDNETSSWPLYDIPSGSHYAWYGDNTTGDFNTTSGSVSTRNSGYLISDDIDLTSITGEIELGFFSWADTESGPSFDQKNVTFSPDGGSSWYFLGNVSVSSGWEHYAFDITDYNYSSNAVVRFSFDTIDNVSNDGTGWMIDDIYLGKMKNERFELEIYQDNNAMIYDKEFMGFNATSYFSHNMNVSINITIIGPSGSENLYFNDTVLMKANSSWYFTVEYNFTEAGDYDVYFVLIDDILAKWEASCWWDIDDGGQDEYFDIWIDQDYTAEVSETEYFSVGINSSFSSYEYFEVEVNITDSYSLNERIYYNSSVGIPSESIWEIELEYIFDYTGHFDVLLSVWDENATLKQISCCFNVYEELDIDIRIIQQTWAILGKTTPIMIQLQNNYDFSVTGNLTVEILQYNTAGDVIATDTIFHEYVFMISEEVKDLSFDHIFYSTGYYEVYAVFIDENGRSVDRWCPFDVYYENEEFFVLRLEQMRETWVNMPVIHWLLIDSHFNDDKNIDLELTIYEEGVTIGTTIFEENIWIDQFSFFKIDVPYSFENSGEYEVRFIVIDNNENIWETWCSWYVKEPEPNTLTYYVEQNYEAMTGEDVWHHLNITSYYDVGQNVEVEVWAHHYQGIPDFIMFSSTEWIAAGESITIDFSWEFSGPGRYELDFRMKTLSDNEYYSTWCVWEIFEVHGFDLWFEPFDEEVEVGSTANMELNIKSNFGHSMDVEVTVILNEVDEFGNLIDKETIYLDETLWIEANSHKIVDITHIFDSAGYFDVHAELFDDGGGYWDTWSYWDVIEGYSGPRVKTYAPHNVNISESFTIEVEVFASDNVSLHVNWITIILDNGTELQNMSIDEIIPAGYSESYDFTAQFNIKGDYEIHIAVDTDSGTLEDDIAIYAGIIEDETTTETVDTGEPGGPDVTPGFESLFILVAMIAIATYFRKRHT
ncbi:MAG: hypothetical protein ACXADY_04340 [Candidatus Hodarchaeales archaeon]